MQAFNVPPIWAVPFFFLATFLKRRAQEFGSIELIDSDSITADTVPELVN